MAEPGAEPRTETGAEREDDNEENKTSRADKRHVELPDEEDAATYKRARREKVRAILCGLLSYRQGVRTEACSTTKASFFVAVSDLIDNANDEMTRDGVHLRCMVIMLMLWSWSNQPRQEALQMLRNTLMVIFTFKGLFFERGAWEDDGKREEGSNEAKEGAQRRRSEEQLDAPRREERVDAAPKESTGVSANEATLQINWGRILTFLTSFCTMVEWLRERPPQHEGELTVEQMIDETCAFVAENLDDWISRNGDWDRLEMWARIQKGKRRRWSVGLRGAAVAAGLAAVTVAFFWTLDRL